MHGCIMSQMICQKKTSKKSWMKDHLPNMTGTPYAYEYKDQKKSDKVKNIYSIWKPDEN